MNKETCILRNTLVGVSPQKLMCLMWQDSESFLFIIELG